MKLAVADLWLGESALPYVFSPESFRLRSLPGFADPPEGRVIVEFRGGKRAVPHRLGVEPQGTASPPRAIAIGFYLL